MKTKLITLIILLVSVTSFSQTFTVDFINYNVSSTSPNTVEITGGDASGLASNLIIPETVTDNGIEYTVTSIAFRAFRQKRKIVSLTIPATMVTIGNEAFQSNPITEIIALGNTPPSISSGTFSNRDTIDFTVPVGTEIAYENAGWTGFASINGNPSVGFGFDAENGFTYTITSSNPLEVSLTNGNNASGAITISGTVIFNDISFRVTAIGNSAFQNNSLSNVVITSLLESIGDNAFRGNTELSAVTSNNTTAPTLGNNVFLDTASVIALNIPDGSETSYADAGWSNNFFSVNGIVTLGGSFTADNGLTYTITSLAPNEVSLTNGNNASGDVIITEELTVNSISFSVTEIGFQAFRADNVTSVIIPSSVTTIGEGAFRRNSDLDEITINNPTPPVLGSLAFAEIASAIILTVPSGSETLYIEAGFTNYVFINEVGQIGNSFTADNGFTYTVTSSNPNEVSLTNGNNASGAITIAGTVSFKDISSRVTAIGNNAFRDDSVTSVVITSLVESIGNNAFRGNTELSSVTSNNTVAPTLGANVFLDTAEGKSLNIPDGSETSYADASWSNNFFSVNGTLAIGSSFTADNGFTYIVTSSNPLEVSLTDGNNASGDITIAGTVTFSDISFRVVAIGNDAFRDDSVTSVVITSLVESIGNNAFRGNTELSSVISNNTTAPILGDNVFLNTATDKALIIPDGSGLSYEEAGWTDFTTINGITLGNTFIVNNLSYEVISALTNEVAITGGTPTTTDLVIPSSVSNQGISFSVTTVGNGAFTSFGLTSVSFPDTIKTIGSTSFRSNSLTSVVIPNSVISMSINAFNNNNIETVVLSENLTSLSTSLFENNNITEVIIPASITTIGNKVFRGNPLTKVIVEGIEPASISGIGANDSFGLSRNTVDLFIPTGTEQAYIDASWTGFKSITEIDFDIFISPKVFLQGASLTPNTGEEDLMRDDLRTANLIPTTSPYGDAITTDVTVFDVAGENAIVDWVFVQLHDATDNTVVVASQSALLQRDGDVVSSDGVSPLAFTVDAGNYFVSINHRNHLGIITENTVALSSTAVALNFTTDINLVAGGTTSIAEISSGVFGLFAGDSNNDAGIRLTDRTQIRIALGERDFYSNNDIDMNGIIQLSEITSIIQNLGSLQQFTTTVQE